MKTFLNKLFDDQLVRIYDNMKQKNAKLAFLISIIFFILGLAANAVLSQDFIVALLPAYLIWILKGAVTLGTFFKVALTGARTTTQIKELNASESPLEADPATNSTEDIKELLNKKKTAPAPNKQVEAGSIEDSI